MWVPVCTDAAKLALTASVLSRSPPLYPPSLYAFTFTGAILDAFSFWRRAFFYFLFLPLQVDVDTCDYLLDLDFPAHPQEGVHEPRYVADTKTWERVSCQPFLDARHSPVLTRTLWFPGELWQAQNEYGELCLLRHGANVAEKEREHTVRRA